MKAIKIAQLLVLSLVAMVYAGFYAETCQAQTGAAKKATTASPQSAPKSADKTAGNSAAKADKPEGGLIDLNSATAAELKTLPGIADAYSAAIIKNRPYANKAQLKSRNVIPPGTYEKIKDKVIAKQK
jgi:DNA uptake protein ComE-like DNA-binding protein